MLRYLYNLLVNLSRKFFIQGIDLGAGKDNRFFFCLPIDQLSGEYLNERSKLSQKNNSLNYAYTSHFVEHITDETFKGLSKEIYRVLKKGGIFRIVTPNFDLIKTCLDEQNYDTANFIAKLNKKKSWKNKNIESNLENWALHWFSAYQNIPYNNSPEYTGILDENFYRGPPVLKAKEVRQASKKMSTVEFGKWCVSHIPTEYIGYGGHINTWPYDKIINELNDIGFTARKCKYMGSKLNILNKLDESTGRVEVSIYIEAYK